MACDVRPYIRLKKSYRTLYTICSLLILFGLFWYTYGNGHKRMFKAAAKTTFDVFDPVYDIFPGQRQLSGQSPDNMLGLSRREAKLVDRVHDIEDENRRLKYFLSKISRMYSIFHILGKFLT